MTKKKVIDPKIEGMEEVAISLNLLQTNIKTKNVNIRKMNIIKIKDHFNSKN